MLTSADTATQLMQLRKTKAVGILDDHQRGIRYIHTDLNDGGCNQHIGFVFQFHQLLPEFTAVENVMMPALIAGASMSDARSRAMEMLDYLRLTDRATHKPNELSGGEKQRVAVARALVNHPDVIMADEPSGSLDSRNKEDLHKLFFDLRDKYGQTFIIVTHDESLATLTDRTIPIKDGIIIDDKYRTI